MSLDDKVRKAMNRAKKAIVGLAIIASALTLTPRINYKTTSNQKPSYQITLQQQAYAQEEAHAAVKRETKINYDKLAKEAEKLNEQERYDEVIRLLEPYAHDKNNKSALFYNELGGAYLERGELDVAEKYFLKAHELNPSYSSPILNLAGIYFLKKDKQKAVFFARMYLNSDGNKKDVAEYIIKKYK